MHKPGLRSISPSDSVQTLRFFFFFFLVFIAQNSEFIIVETRILDGSSGCITLLAFLLLGITAAFDRHVLVFNDFSLYIVEVEIVDSYSKRDVSLAQFVGDWILIHHHFLADLLKFEAAVHAYVGGTLRSSTPRPKIHVFFNLQLTNTHLPLLPVVVLYPSALYFEAD